MEFEFIRRLVKDVPQEQVIPFVEALFEEGMELYQKAEGDSYRIMSSTDECEEGDVYICASDWGRGKEIAIRMELLPYLCTPQEARVVRSELEIAEEKYFRKQKRQQVFCLVLMAGVAIYWLVKAFLLQ